VLFGQTCTASGDSMRQYAIAKSAHPKKPVIMDIECDAGCGVVPMRYRDKSFVNAMQWVIGLETFLLFDDPWRIFLTTDHPNGAPFFFYPHLIRLLMDKSFRDDMLQKINPDAQAQSSLLKSLTREYTLDEIAILTRAGPAKSLGLAKSRSFRRGRAGRYHRLSRRSRPRGDVRCAGICVQERRGGGEKRQGGEGGAGRDPRGAA
jgi:formylmethanofuran dehydrogenase subunit A